MDKDRKDLIEKTLVEGVRAMGNRFRLGSYRKKLEDAPIETIIKMHDAFAGKAKKLFPGGQLIIDIATGE